MTGGKYSFNPLVMAELARCLPASRRTEAAIHVLQERLQTVAKRYRQMIESVPSDLPGAPLGHMTLTKRHEWVDTHILNPIERIKEALAQENRPLLSTWPEFMGSPPEIDIVALTAELDRLENLGKYLWMSARIRRDAKVPVGWEIKYEIVSAVAGVLAELAPEVTPSRGTGV